jgi:alpha-glucosidase
MDDGKTLAYTRGQFLRVEYSCEMTPNGLTLRIGEHQGTFHPWWNRIHVEVYGWDSASATVTVNGNNDPPASVDTNRHMLSVELDDQIHGCEVDIRKSN